MATGSDLRRIALSLEGTAGAPHFHRAAFKVVRNYATLPADGRTANLRFTPDEQEFKCMMAPEAFAPVPNAEQARLDYRPLVQAQLGGAQERTRDGVGACCAEETQAPVSHEAISDAGKSAPVQSLASAREGRSRSPLYHRRRYPARPAPQN